MSVFGLRPRFSIAMVGVLRRNAVRARTFIRATVPRVHLSFFALRVDCEGLSRVLQ